MSSSIENSIYRRGDRLALRDWTLADVSALKAALQPDQEWHRFNGPYYPVATSEQVDEQIRNIERRIRDRDWDSPRRVLAVCDAVSDALIGRVNWYWQSEETQWVSLGLAIFDPSHWGRGLGYEALGLWSQETFDSRPELVRLDLRTWSGNVGMMRLAEKLGYREEARFRKARIVNGEYYDGLGYGILRDEWHERYPQGFVASLSQRDSSPGRKPADD